MQSIFRLPWCADQIAPKMQTGKAALDNMRASPVMDIPMLNKLKRKRTESPEPRAHFLLQPVKKQRTQEDCTRKSPPVTSQFPMKSEREYAASMALEHDKERQDVQTKASPQASVTHARQDPDQAQQARKGLSLRVDDQNHTHAPSTQQAAEHMAEDVAMNDAHATSPAQTSDLTPLQQVIENEFNLQILMKHNELRLIEQELAKCQIALEQLRRCELRPYPGTERPAASVSSGVGLSSLPPPGFTRPAYAAPHGVTDGPYTKHYKHWLLHDPAFDPTPLSAVSSGNNTLQSDARSMRNANTVRRPTQKTFPIAATLAEVPKSQSTYQATARKHKIAVVKRSTDGQLVKLVCNHCHRSDFSNSQGFLNHCRIGHKVEYKSHDHAAIDCGQALDEQELASVPPETHAAPAHKPSASRSASVSNTPYKGQNFVHPMNTSTGVFAASSPAHTSAQQSPLKPVPGNRPLSTNRSPFKAASQAPRLSAQFAKHHLGGDLEAAIATAKQKVDFGVEEEPSPDAMDSASPLTPASAGGRTIFGVPRAGSLAPSGVNGRPPSRKGYRPSGSRPRPSPLVQIPANADTAVKQEQLESDEVPESPHDRSMDFSPHTADSNPGLVSDHEDDDHGSVSEDEVPQATIAHSLGVSRRDCTDSMDIGVSVDDDMDEHGVIIRRNSMLAQEDARLRTTGSPSRKLGGVKARA